ncbi:MAG: efflux RND transporter permease subunit [Betaproteobacteria bacterium]|nr:efflux RND transporter permease subunit [Betaproteobacteria bacterium]
MWIVQIALRRPYTFIVLALLLLILGPLVIRRTPTDIFPAIDIPVVSVVWSYNGLPADEMATRMIANFERALTTTVNDIEHIESQSLPGVGVVKVFFQPRTNIDVALSQVTAISQTLLRQLPPGSTPPLVLSYNASSVPILQLALSSSKLAEQELFDLGNQFIRTQLATVQGASVPFPYGGKTRQVMVDLDPAALQSRHLTAADVSSAIGAQNVIVPSGSQKLGDIQYSIKLNGSPVLVDELNDLPIKTVNGATVFVRDVAHVRDGFPPQQNIVRVDGTRAALMTIQKTGSASTLDIIERVKERLPLIQEQSPPELDISLLADQSLFVSAAVEGVIKEGVIAAVLTSVMILIFLGSWRSTLIIALSIPLSVLASIITLSALGETINIMTLGGLALAVGILVDDATVAIENINYHLEQGKEVEIAILDGAQQIALPALVSTLAICIVFVPMFFLEGVARFLFVPMAQAVVFAMLASYILSRTLVPTLAKYLLKPHAGEGERARPKGALARFQRRFERGFERTRNRYHDLLTHAIAVRGSFIALFLLATVASFLLLPWVGRDFFPDVDAGQIKLHLRAPTGTRVEETARLANEVETAIRSLIPGGEIGHIVANVGLPTSGINLSYSNSAPIGSSDADVLISLTPEHGPTQNYIRTLRRELPERFPGVMFAFLPADIVSQILNFGLPAPIDIQIVGNNFDANRVFAARLLEKVRRIPGTADMRIQQAFNQPELRVEVDRSRALDLGLSQRDVANNLLITLAGSFQTAPSFWLNRKNGVSYQVVTQAPEYRVAALQDLQNLPVGTSDDGDTQILGGVARITRGFGMGVVSHYNVQNTVDIFGAVQDRDLGGVTAEVERVIEEMKPELPRGSRVVMRGQAETLQSSYLGLLSGLVLAIVLVYLLLVVNFQSWTDPFIIITALPAALAGIVWMLFITHTPFSVPALTGAIMCMGVATANSILIVSFARERLAAGASASRAALDAGFVRLRPVLMTALAMIIGMVPLALGLGEGGEQNAPLGRAVIGGLLLATVSTLFFVPTVFAVIHTRRQAKAAAAEAGA